MTRPEFIAAYSALAANGKVSFLAQTSHQLTIALRGTYPDPAGEATTDEQSFKRLQGANELQHHLSSELRHIHAGDPDRYPDDVLMNILFEKADFYGISGELSYSLLYVMKRFQK
ncbi:hypothetical protein [Terriglobus albidus]|uniref:hypothetical protein n=1 Tax=Terriglobus albidus TaxID=1592106 RepID=UPI0021DF47CF|nr:hypothetical protein [Terriglobus albidus]